MKNKPWEKWLSDKKSRSAQWPVLTKIDADLAAQARKQGCHCGGALHRSDYKRKVRGVEVAENVWRHSFCCAVKGCRQRLTPGSVRFFGRKVYAGFMVVLLTALSHGLTEARVQILCEQLGVDRRMLERWRRWWLDQFVQQPQWRVARAQFLPPVDAAALPGSLWERFRDQQSEDDPLLALLRFLVPWTVPTAPAK